MKTVCKENKHHWKCLAPAGHYKCTTCGAKSIFDRVTQKKRIITNKKRKRVLQDNLDCADNGTPEWALMKLMQLASTEKGR